MRGFLAPRSTRRAAPAARLAADENASSALAVPPNHFSAVSPPVSHCFGSSASFPGRASACGPPPLLPCPYSPPASASSLACRSCSLRPVGFVDPALECGATRVQRASFGGKFVHPPQSLRCRPPVAGAGRRLYPRTPPPFGRVSHENGSVDHRRVRPGPAPVGTAVLRPAGLGVGAVADRDHSPAAPPRARRIAWGRASKVFRMQASATLRTASGAGAGSNGPYGPRCWRPGGDSQSPQTKGLKKDAPIILRVFFPPPVLLGRASARLAAGPFGTARGRRSDARQQPCLRGPSVSFASDLCSEGRPRSGNAPRYYINRRRVGVACALGEPGGIALPGRGSLLVPAGTALLEVGSTSLVWTRTSFVSFYEPAPSAAVPVFRDIALSGPAPALGTRRDLSGLAMTVRRQGVWRPRQTAAATDGPPPGPPTSPALFRGCVARA